MIGKTSKQMIFELNLGRCCSCRVQQEQRALHMNQGTEVGDSLAY